MPRLNHGRNNLRKWPLVVVALAAVGIGYYIIASFASGSSAAFEAESGSLTCGASVSTTSGASGGKTVSFNTCPPTTTPAPTPPPVAGIKAILSGAMDRGGDWLNCIETSGANPLPVKSCFAQQVPQKPYLNAQTFEIDWRNIEPAQGSYNWQPIDDAVASVAGRGMRMRLKVETGVYSPAWAMNLGGSPVPFYNQNTYLGGDRTVPRYWTSSYQGAYHAFMTAMAARYDGSATVAEVEMCEAGLVSCEEFLITGNDKTSDGVTNAQHLYNAGLTDSLHMQTIQDDINLMAGIWHKTHIIMTVQPFHQFVKCPSACADGGGISQYTYDLIDGNRITETPAGGGVTITGLAVAAPALAEFFHPGLGPKVVGGTQAQPNADSGTVALYNYMYNTGGSHNRSNRAYTVPLQTETYGRMDVAWASALNYACSEGAVAVELPHGYTGWEKLSGSWPFSYAAQHTDTAGLSVMNDANACYKHNATLHP